MTSDTIENVDDFEEVGKPKIKDEGNPYMSTDDAFSLALEMVKGIHIPRDKVYVWRQRFREGSLSHKKIQEIMELAGFKVVIEEKWIQLKMPKKKTGHKEDKEE